MKIYFGLPTDEDFIREGQRIGAGDGEIMEALAVGRQLDEMVRKEQREAAFT